MKQVMNYNKDNGLLNMIRNRPHDRKNDHRVPWSKCRLSPCYMPSLSLLARVFSPVPTYIPAKEIPFLAFFSSFSSNIGIYFVYLHRETSIEFAYA